MPILGYGTLKLGNQKETQKAVEEALEVGYRLFDTAQSYLNEEGVGYAIKATGVKREEIFITAKLFSQNYKKVGDTKKSYEESLKKLHIDYADLFLIHQPIGDVYGAYREMIEIYNAKKVRAIGVSNFYPARFIDFYLNFDIKPAVNQIECHPYFQQQNALKLAKSLNVQLEAHSPLYQVRENILQNPILSQIAKKHNKSVAQIILRWHTQRGIIAIPKTSKKERMIENLNIFDFSLVSNDMAQISTLQTNKPLLDHPNNPELIRWFNERKPGTSLSRN